MDNPPNPPNPPSGGTPPPPTPPPGITQEELHKAIEKARLEEREKLRTQLSEAETSVKTMKAEVASAKDQITKLTEKVDSLTAGKKPEGGVDVEKAIESAVQATANRLAKEYSDQIKALRDELEAEKSTRQKLTIEQRRVQMIQAAGGETVLIPELVVGSNEDEIKESIERSKTVYARTVAKAGGASPSLPNPTGNPGESTPSAPLGAAASTGGAATAVPGQRIPLSEYAKNRETLKRNAAARYPTGALR
jgi:hypothetical protein